MWRGGVRTSRPSATTKPCAACLARSLVNGVMDLWTKFLLGATAFALAGYVGLVYSGCALDPDCHFRTCYHKQLCGVVYGQPPHEK